MGEGCLLACGLRNGRESRRVGCLLTIAGGKAESWSFVTVIGATELLLLILPFL